MMATRGWLEALAITHSEVTTTDPTLPGLGCSRLGAVTGSLLHLAVLRVPSQLVEASLVSEGR